MFMDDRTDFNGLLSFQLKKTHTMRHRDYEISEHIPRMMKIA